MRVILQTALPFLIGTKYDAFANLSKEEQEEITNQARKFSKAMKAPLIFTSSSMGINVQKIFKIVLSKSFDLKCNIPVISDIGAPILEYQVIGMLWRAITSNNKNFMISLIEITIVITARYCFSCQLLYFGLVKYAVRPDAIRNDNGKLLQTIYASAETIHKKQLVDLLYQFQLVQNSKRQKDPKCREN